MSHRCYTIPDAVLEWLSLVFQRQYIAGQAYEDVQDARRNLHQGEDMIHLHGLSLVLLVLDK